MRGLALLVATLAAAAPAAARANDQFAFRIQLDTGKVTPLPPPPRGGPRLPPWTGTRTFVTHRPGRLAVYDQRFGTPNQLRFEVEIAPAGGTLAWNLVQGRHAVFAWRSALPADGGPREYRDRIGCLDLETGASSGCASRRRSAAGRPSRSPTTACCCCTGAGSRSCASRRARRCVPSRSFSGRRTRSPCRVARR